MIRGTLLVLFVVVCVLQSCKRDELEFGQVWQHTSHTTARLNNIRFLDDSICVIGGGSTFYGSVMLRSADGGYNWSADSSAEAPKELYGMGVAADGTVYLSGIDGCVLHSRDKGKTWKFNRIGNWLESKGGCFFSADTGIFVSSVLQRQSTITRVDSNFRILDEQTFLFGLNNVYMINTHTGYAIGYGVIMKTTDRGNTWAYLDVDGDNFTAMAQYGGTIWVCGSSGSIFRSADGGANWARLRNGNNISLPRYILRCILFTDAQHGWAAGDDGTVIYTKDGGENWVPYKPFTSKTIRSIAQSPNGNLVLAGDAGTIYRIVL